MVKKFNPISRSKSLLICTNVFQNNLKNKQDTQQEANQTNQKDGTEPENVDQRIAKLKKTVKGRYIQIIVINYNSE